MEWGYGNTFYQNTLERVNDVLCLFVSYLSQLHIRITFLFLAILFNFYNCTRFTIFRGLNQILLLNGALLLHYQQVAVFQYHYICRTVYSRFFYALEKSLRHATLSLHQQQDLFIQYCVTIYTVYSSKNYDFVQLFSHP